MKLKTLYEILNNSVKNFSERIAFSLWRGGSYTFKQVGEKVAEVQELLRSAGLKKGDKVVLMSQNPCRATPSRSCSLAQICDIEQRHKGRSLHLAPSAL